MASSERKCERCGDQLRCETSRPCGHQQQLRYMRCKRCGHRCRRMVQADAIFRRSSR